jgi:hypothetical protein
MVRGASVAIRLANDLRSYEKEVAEGNVNSLVILGRQARAEGQDAATAHTAALAYVRQAIVDCLTELDTLERGAVTRTGQPEAAINGIATFVCGFYRQYDYHTFLRQVS